MDENIKKGFEVLWSGSGDSRYQAFIQLLETTDQTVDWAYEVWDELVQNLGHKDNQVRAIAAQLLSNLAKSDPQQRMLKDFPPLLAVTRDKRFVTARHTLQSIWKVGAAGQKQKKIVLAGLEKWFGECISEKNCTLIRYDILQGLRNLYDELGDEEIKELSLALIESEDDLKYRKKYSTVWRTGHKRT